MGVLPVYINSFWILFGLPMIIAGFFCFVKKGSGKGSSFSSHNDFKPSDSGGDHYRTRSDNAMEKRERDWQDDNKANRESGWAS